MPTVILIRRYSDTRHCIRFPAKNLSLESAIDKESDLLEPLRSRADLIVDTSKCPFTSWQNAAYPSAG